MELGEVGARHDKVDLVVENNPSSMNERIVLAVVVVFGIISLVAVILAAVAVSRPVATSDSSKAGASGGSSPAVVNCYGASGGAGGAPSGGNRIYTIAMGHNWGAYEYIDENGFLSGFSKDLIAEVCTAAGMDCRTVWEPYTNCFDSQAGQHPRGGQGLMDRWYDACDGWYVTINRQAIFKFASSFLKPVKSQFVVKRGNPSGVSESNFDTKKIGFIDGWAYDEKCLYRLYKKLLPKDKIFHETSQATLKAKLESGALDAVYVGTVDLYDYIEAVTKKGNTPTLERIGAEKSCMVRGGAMMSRKDSDFSAKWNEGFNKIMANGRYKKICDAAPAAHGHRGDVDCL